MHEKLKFFQKKKKEKLRAFLAKIFGLFKKIILCEEIFKLGMIFFRDIYEKQ